MGKILFIGNITDGTGYSNASREYLSAIDHSNIDVAYRNVRFSHNFQELSERHKELERKDSSDATILITNLLPNMYDYDGRFAINVGIFSSETADIPYEWVRSLRVMDQVWVPNKQMERMLKAKYGFKTPVHIVPFPLSPDKFLENENEKINNARLYKQTNPRFSFLHIGEFVARKNYETLITAYLSEFSPFDNTCLTIKTHLDNATNEQVKAKIDDLVNHIKKSLGLRYYPELNIIIDKISRNDLEMLQRSADCYVSASHGESCALPVRDSICYGVPVIVPECTGFKDYLTNGVAYFADCEEVPCYGVFDSSWYKGNQNWWNVSLRQLKARMRDVFENYGGVYTRKRSFCLRYRDRLFKDYGYETIGTQIKSLLHL
jgi:glycosyltransferase involved in cell wall biosynthesis